MTENKGTSKGRWETGCSAMLWAGLDAFTALYRACSARPICWAERTELQGRIVFENCAGIDYMKLDVRVYREKGRCKTDFLLNSVDGVSLEFCRIIAVLGRLWTKKVKSSSLNTVYWIYFRGLAEWGHKRKRVGSHVQQPLLPLNWKSILRYHPPARNSDKLHCKTGEPNFRVKQ